MRSDKSLGGEAMFARIGTFDVDPSRLDEAKPPRFRDFRGPAMPPGGSSS